jgi:DNA-binding LacI/PurR family transcriptional regulator
MKAHGSQSPPTIRDVARAAGVSVATVSNVMNERPGLVGKATRLRVLSEIERLGYRPRAGARSLRTQRSQTFAIILVDESAFYLQDPFPAAVVAAFTSSLNDMGYVSVVHGCRLADIDKAAALRQLGIDGVCLMASGDDTARLALLEKMAAWRHPLVLLQETQPICHEDVCVIRQDDYGGGVAIGKHLAAKRHRHVALFEPMLEWPAVTARFQGVRDGLNGDAQVMISHIHSRSEHFESARDAVITALVGPNPPDAIVGANDRMATAALIAARLVDLAVPDALAVVGFNALDVWTYQAPRLTTVISAPAAIGKRAALALVNRLDTGSFSEIQVSLPVSFLQGETA